VLSKLRPKLSYANVVSTLCLFILLGGSSYAAVKLGKNAVKSKNIAANAVTSPKVKNGSLLSQDFKAGQIPQGDRGLKGDKGDKGDTGDKGEQGQTGPPGPTFASISGDDPPASPQYLNTSSLAHEFTTPSAGRLLAIAHWRAIAFECTAGSPTVGLYLDGAPVPATKREMPNDTLQPYDVAGVSETVAAGPHTVGIGVQCSSGGTVQIIQTVDGGHSIGAVLLG
jgi:hypothetical protein